MVDIVDSDFDDRISDKLSRTGSISKSKHAFNKTKNSSSYGGTKYFLEDRCRDRDRDRDRDSPTFSPLNSVQNKNKKSIEFNNHKEKSKVEKPSLDLSQIKYSKQNSQRRQNKQFRYQKQVKIPLYDLDEQFHHSKKVQKDPIIPQNRYHQYSPYSQGGMVRRTRCSSYFTGKQNNYENSNYLSSNFKKQQSILPLDQKYRYHGNRTSNTNSHMIEQNNRNKQLQKQNQQLKNMIKQLKTKISHSEQKQDNYQKIITTMQQQFKKDISSTEGLSQFIKTCQKNQSFINSVIDMKLKITGKSETNLKDLWRWLKSQIQQLNQKKQLISWIKEDYFSMSNSEPDELIRLRLMDKLRR